MNSVLYKGYVRFGKFVLCGFECLNNDHGRHIDIYAI